MERVAVLLYELLHVLGPAVVRCAVRVGRTGSPPLALARSSARSFFCASSAENVSWSRHGSNKVAFGSKLPSAADAGAHRARGLVGRVVAVLGARWR